MILVSGANGVVGQPLCQRLSNEGRDYYSITRDESRMPNKLQWNLSMAPSTDVLARLEQTTSMIHCAPIWLLVDHLPLLYQSGVKRLVVFSSTSVLSKCNSENKQEQHLVNQLRESENILISYCQSNQIKLFILRPSLIYGYARDENITHIARFIQRYGFMLLAGEGRGLRQPVHADDLVEVALHCLDVDTPKRTTYNLTGGETLSYRGMVKRIFNGLGKRPLIIPIPLFLFRIALLVAARIRRFSYTPEMANRMNQDLNYDCSDAKVELDFQPQGFLEKPDRDLPL